MKICQSCPLFSPSGEIWNWAREGDGGVALPCPVFAACQAAVMMQQRLLFPLLPSLDLLHRHLDCTSGGVQDKGELYWLRV